MWKAFLLLPFGVALLAQGDDTFAGAHAPLIQPSKKPDPGALTARVAATLPGSASESGRVRRVNYIDEQIFGKMQRDGIAHAPLATDAEFFRRVHLDLTGRIPAATEVQAFLTDSNPNKRNQLIDKLLASEAFVTQRGLAGRAVEMVAQAVTTDRCRVRFPLRFGRCDPPGIRAYRAC